jgi:Alpha 1,4-glycosyltransferase conserved region/Glycosyltransferase sugar-binding region containing DXD motif
MLTVESYILKSMSLGKRSIAAFLTILTVCWLILVVRNESYRAADSLTLSQSRIRTADADNTTMAVGQLEVETAGPLFHIVFTVETFSTLNLRCIESIFYFHPNARLRIYSNALSGLLPTGDSASQAGATSSITGSTNNSSALRKLPIGIRALIELGHDIKIVSYSAADILGKAVQKSRQTKSSLLNTSATAIWASRLGVWKTENYWYSNEANLLRLCLLYTEGGIYLDTDVILVRPLVPRTFRPPRELSRDTFEPNDSADETGLALDNAMARDGRSFHNAVMKFMQPGNPLLAAAITDFVQHYNGTVWGNNGPRVFRRTCMVHTSMLCPDLDSTSSDERLATEAKQKPDCWLQPLPAESFQPVPWRQWGDYCFNRQKSPIHAKAVRIVSAPGVYAIHLNNHIFGEALEKGLYVAGSVCDHVLHAYCILPCQRSTNETVHSYRAPGPERRLIVV